MDINSDVGELNNLLADNTYEKLMDHVDSVNIACGGHAGDETMMAAMINIAIVKNVNIGAHPSYPDKENFGRNEMDIDSNELLDVVRDQVQLLVDIAENNGGHVSHVKPHGALYNKAAHNEVIAQSIGEAIIQVDPSLKVMGLAGSGMISCFDELGLETISESFADRAYENDGSLRERKHDDALITDPIKAANQARDLTNGFVMSVEGSRVEIDAQTICIHSDTPNAVALASAVKETIQ
ncbi:MAG: 5-oxoprolinase subunit PxpA [Candidatus Marinimicrobia bacterium]|nr:5-oxoprolinase subunit PxpA [Candidatus Neomarinimicrobiota bacterium]